VSDFLGAVINEAERGLYGGGIPMGSEFIRAHPALWGEDIGE